MNALKSYLEKNFGEIHRYVGELPIISLHSKGEAENIILLVGSEHGDKPHGTKALISLAEKIRDKPLIHTQIDIVPTLDTKGYPFKRTSYADAGFGAPLTLDKAYYLPEDKRPAQLRNLFTILNEVYDLSLMLTTTYTSESPLINGYFVLVQGETRQEDGKEYFSISNPFINDLSGTILQTLKNENISSLDKSEDGFLGEQYLLLKNGVVVEGDIEKTKLGKKVKKLEIKNGFLKSCKARGTPALILSALASSENDASAITAHEKALEAMIKMHEGKNFKL